MVLHGMAMIYLLWCDSASTRIHRPVVWSWWNVPFQICSISRIDEIGNHQSQRLACPNVKFPLLSCPICRHGPSLPSQFYRWCQIYIQAYLGGRIMFAVPQIDRDGIFLGNFNLICSQANWFVVHSEFIGMVCEFITQISNGIKSILHYEYRIRAMRTKIKKKKNKNKFNEFEIIFFSKKK